MKNLLFLIFLCVLACADGTNKPSTNAIPIPLQSAKTNAPVAVPVPDFRQGVLYGAALARRNQDLDGELLVQFAIAAWKRDHPGQ